MAEIFGVVAGAVSLAALFNNCVDSFEYIQLARHFGDEFGRCQLKIDILKLRLSRWGEAASINEGTRYPPDDKLAQQIRSILEEIGFLYQAIQKSCKRYEINATEEQLQLYTDSDLGPVVRSVHTKLGEITQRRQKKTSLAKKARWALYDGKQLERLIDQAKEFLEDLEALVPVESQRQDLAKQEVECLNDAPSLELMAECAQSTDIILAQTIEVTIQSNEVHNTIIGALNTTDSARVFIGNQLSSDFDSARSLNEQTRNSANSVQAEGTSRLHVGNTYGGRSFWDD
ncbi:hypothetical protein VHEMI04324 [[Torrubiella] hemipterigena]|uniref:Prion-inhibition and propagation HeLo domain-containing protein n=1 Tax=[Torrubiella] hemipterigena TaxID=1531966 RepID=A0A0A1T0X3_9HYPO|nr:hypothetical protein VHEMI04324 [[Torrubiella] hemipterigena]